MNRIWSMTSAVILGGLMVWMWAYPKFWAGLEVHPVFGWSELLSGMAFIDPYARWAVGAVVLASIVMLVFNRTRLAGAVIAAAISVFYLVLHATPWLGMAIPTYETLSAGLAAGLTPEQIRAAGRLDDVHVVMTLVNGLMALVVISAELGLRREASETARLGRFAY